MTKENNGLSNVHSNDLLCKWTLDTKEFIEIAGFKVTLWHGLPLVEIPEDIPEGVRLLKLSLPHGGYKTLYKEGMLVTPVNPVA